MFEFRLQEVKTIVFLQYYQMIRVGNELVVDFKINPD